MRDDSTKQLLEQRTIFERNILLNKPATRNATSYVAEPLESFSLFMSNSFIETIVVLTNSRISTLPDQFLDLAQVFANLYVHII